MKLPTIIPVLAISSLVFLMPTKPEPPHVATIAPLIQNAPTAKQKLPDHTAPAQAKLASVVVQKPAEKPKPAVAPPSAPTGDCASEIAKYDWRQDVALAVATAESGLNPNALNNNPATRDYSVGCFQVNLYGANARNRPSEAELKNAEINVRWAYNNYKSNGHSFIGQWGVCQRNVSCY